MAAPRKFDYDDARRRYANGESGIALAAEYGVSSQAVYRAVNDKMRERMDDAASAYMRDHRTICKGGCGRLVWTYAMAHRSGYCPTCNGLRLRAAEHGTEVRYSSPYKCRCDLCRQAASAAKRARREASRQPCVHGCGTLVDTINRGNPSKPLECRLCALRRIKAEQKQERLGASVS